MKFFHDYEWAGTIVSMAVVLKSKVMTTMITEVQAKKAAEALSSNQE